MARAGGKDLGLLQLKGSKDWWIRWHCHLGHEHREKAGSKTFARQLYAKRQTQKRELKFCLALEREKLKHHEQEKFNLVAEQYLAWAELHRPRSIRFRRTCMNHLVAYFGDTPLSQIGKLDVEKFIQTRLDSGAAPASINRSRAVLSTLFNKAQDWQLCNHNPVRGLTQLRENNVAPRPITPDEERRLSAVLPDRIAPIVTLALHTGLRMNELKVQRWVDIDLVDGLLTVTQPKSDKREVLPLNAVVQAFTGRTSPDGRRDLSRYACVDEHDV